MKRFCGCRLDGVCTPDTRYIANADGLECEVNCKRNKAYDKQDMDNYKVNMPTAMSRLLLDPLQPILAERGKEYGDFGVMSECIQKIKAVYREYGLDRLPAYQREALEMDAVKTGRILVGNENNVDSWRDKAGYSTLVADRIPKAASGEILPLPRGWKPNQYGGFDNAQDQSHWAGTIEGLYQHLGLKRP